MFRLLAILLTLIPLSNQFFFELPNLLGQPARPAGGGGQCCCPPPPCGGGGGEYVPPPRYEQPPPPPPPPPPSYVEPSYVGGYKKSKRSTKDLEANSLDEMCNSVEVRDIIKQGMTEDEKSSRKAIVKLLNGFQKDMVVVCSSHDFDFQASKSTEFCSVKGEKFTCSAFVF